MYFSHTCTCAVKEKLGVIGLKNRRKKNVEFVPLDNIKKTLAGPSSFQYDIVRTKIKVKHCANQSKKIKENEENILILKSFFKKKKIENTIIYVNQRGP